MIIIYFLYFIIAMLVFSMSPTTSMGLFTPAQNILSILVVFLGFWHYNRFRFNRLRYRLDKNIITPERAKKEFTTRLNIQFVVAILLFILEIFTFDLKFFIMQTSVPGLEEFFGNAAGLMVFVVHLSMIWYWGYRSMGDVLDLGDSAKKYILSNIKFNLAIVLPWLILSFVFDVLRLFFPRIDVVMTTPILREAVLVLFIVALAIFAPVFIARLWDCEPMPPSELKGKITAFCRAQGIKFKGIMTWNALGKGLVTAGVMGVIAPFRYLMITPSLMSMLDEDEIMAVVSHEVGHVKKKHIVLYIVFFIGLMFLLGYIRELVRDFFLTTSAGLSMITTSRGLIDPDIFFFPLSLVFFVLYLRFVFGYFMRNFERQADVYCFESGIDPNFMIASFTKLQTHLGENGKKNWHHYTLSQRIDFVRTSMENPRAISRHSKKVKLQVTAFIALLVLAMTALFTFYDGQSDLKRQAQTIEIRLEENPDNHVLYAVLGETYYQLKEWKNSKKAYEYSIGLKHDQPVVLNNLAWLLLTSEDESLRNPERALALARESVEMNETQHVMDTLAEAYYQNGMYMEAYRAAKRALQLATEDRSHYEAQLKKIKKAIMERGESPS